MRAVLFRLAAELRARWRSWVGVSVLAGVFYGCALAAIAGAQRTDSVVERSVRLKVTPDVYVVPAYTENGELLRFDAIAGFPEVARSYLVPMFQNRDGWDLYGISDQALTNSGKLLEGRLPRPAASDEATINIVGRERRSVHVGDTVDLHLAEPGYTGEGDFPAGPETKVKIVGVTASLADFASAAGPGVAVSGAFVDTFKDRVASADLYMFELKRKTADLPSFRRHMSELTGGKPVLFVEGRNDWVQIQRSFHVQATSLWLLATFLGFAVFLVFTQTLARLTWLESADHDTLSVLGMSRWQRWGLAVGRGLFLGSIAAAVAVSLAIVLSWAMPFGRPRLAEVSPGFWAPGALLALGFAVILVVVLVQCTVPALWRRASTSTGSRSAVAGRVASAVPGTAAGVGVRFALESGQGADAVPARSTLAGATIGVMAVTIALTVTASLAHLLDTPRLYGWAWDTAADLSQAGPDAPAKLESVPGVAAVGYGNLATQVSVGQATAELVSMEPGPVQPVMLEGRRPVSGEEIALARKTLSAAHAHVGSWVKVAMQGQGVERRLRVVGVAVLPVDSDVSTLGEGALVSGTGLRAFVPEVRPDTAFVRYSGGSDRGAMDAAIASVAGGEEHLQVPQEPSALVDFGRVRSLPFVLAGILATLAVATVAYLLASSTQRRRRDLAILKTIGLRSGQLRAVVIWQGLTISVLALLVGVPLGVAAGRWIWLLFARDTGFVNQSVTKVFPLAVVGVIAAALASGVGWALGTGAARTPAATVLRSE